MPFKIFCAGCSKEERAAVELTVKRILDSHGRGQSWTVSVVKFGNGWSVSIDGPVASGRGRSFMLTGPSAPEAIGDAVRSAIDASAVAPVGASVRPASILPPDPMARREEHTCTVCGRQFVLVYEAEPDEPLEEAPVACPHCWQVGRVQVARSASVGRDYRADKV